MSKMLSIYITKSENLYGDQYSFDNFIYLNKKSKSFITCKDHGDFLQNFDKHLCAVAPSCPVCRLSYKKNRLKEVSKKGLDKDALSRAISLLNKTFTLEDDLVLIPARIVREYKIQYNCNNCFETVVTTLNSLKASRNFKKHCKKCVHKFTRTPDFSKDVLPYLSDYTIKLAEGTSYISKEKSSLVITCHKHPDDSFIRSFEKFQGGQTCPSCKLEKNKREGRFPGGYSKEYFDNYPKRKDVKGFVYYIRFGNMYKIGVSVNYQSRYKSLRNLFKNLDSEIIQIHETTIYDAFCIEQKVLEVFDKYRLYTKKSTELFKIDVLKDLALGSFSIKNES